MAEDDPSGLASEQSHAQRGDREKLAIDKTRLNELVRAASKQGALFGKDVSLTAKDKDEIKLLVNAIAGEVKQVVKENPQWTEFQKTLTDLSGKGEILSFRFPPSWLINGGSGSAVTTKYEKGKGTSIVVPDDIYNAYFWQQRARMLKDSLSAEDGTSTKHLAKELKDAAYFLRARRLL